MRFGEHNYVSLESALSEYGLIAQIPIDRLTIMTTGRSSTYKTSFGIIEYTHTKRSFIDIIQGIHQQPNRPLCLGEMLDESENRNIKVSK